IDSGLVPAANADAKKHFGRVRGNLARQARAVTRAGADELGVDGIEVEVHAREALAENAVAELCLRIRVGPCIGEVSDGFPAPRITDRDLVHVGGRNTARAGNAY